MQPIIDLLRAQGGNILRLIAVLLLAFQLFQLMGAYELKLKSRMIWLVLVCYGLQNVIVMALLDFFWREDMLLSSLRESLFHIPAFWYAGFETAFLILSIYFEVMLIRYRKTHLTQAAIKETMDLLPVGICFGDPDGKLSMSNIQMNEACLELTGENLVNLDAFWKKILSIGERQNDQILLRVDDGALLFSRSNFRIETDDYQQILATDISMQYEMTQQLREQNKHLRIYQERMKNYQKLSAEMIRSEEILNARREVHDQVGHVLLTARYYFTHPENVDKSALLDMLKQTNLFLLQEAEDDDLIMEPVRHGVQMAESIGVRVELKGALPASLEERTLIGYAIRECAANTVKHGGGDLLSVRLVYRNQKVRVQLENNGRTVVGKIKESGGLLNLRRMAEKMDASMRVVTRPAFMVIFEWKEKQENEGNGG
ncbi:MAG: hypothetical protein J6P72_10030 [Firmicutes bacterium]|nr:hypothetical protein [Bacillota bacterium]